MITGTLIGILFIILPLYCWKYYCAYKDFPFYLLYSDVGQYFLKNKRKNLSLASFVFQKIIEVSKRYESEGAFTVWLLKPVLVIYNEEFIKTFSNEPEAIDRGYMYAVYKDVFGSGMATINGAVWRKRCKILNPVFHINVLLEKMPIFSEQSDVLVESLKKQLGKPSADLTKDIRICTFNILCEAILGVKINCDLKNETLELIYQLSDFSITRITSPWLHCKFMLKFFSYGRKGLQLIRKRDETTKKIFSLIKESISHTTPENSVKTVHKNIVHALIDYHQNDPSITVEDIESEIIVFMASGFVTSGTTLIWCLFLLGLHEEIQERVFEEVEPATGKFLSYENICDFKYLDCVIKETLRLYPTVPLYARHLQKDVRCGKHMVPKDTTIAFFPYRLLRNPDVYPDPEKFIPDRFLDPSLEKQQWNFAVFSEGIRHCIGKKFAMMEIKVILAKILQNYKIISLDKREDVRLRWAADLSPEKPPRMQIRPRRM